jgi:hypothetical protein
MRRWPVYPFLLAVYPVLALAAQNADELFTLTDLLRPLALTLGVAAVAWLGASACTRDPDKRAAMAGVVMVAFALHAPLERAVEAGRARLGAPPPDGTETPLAVLVGLLLMLGLGLAIARAPWNLRALSRYLDLTAMILVLWPAVSLARVVLRGAPPPRPIASAPAPRETGGPRPDIYLLVLDEYTGARSLRARYGFDNSPFEDGLRRRGFVVPRASRSNYVWTFLSLASMLNWRYLDDLAEGAGPARHDPRPVFTLIRDNRTWESLARRGYRFVFFPTAFPFTATNPHAHRQLPDPALVTGEFEGVWRRSTPLAALTQWGCQIVSCARDAFPYTPETAQRISWKFEQLAALPGPGAPMFVFAHLAVPHEPFIFHADCSPRRPYWPSFEDRADPAETRAAYVAQIRCVNRQIETFVDAVLARSAAPPIIVLQSDHGYALMGRRVLPLSKVTQDQVDERTDIFAAYYLPAGGAAEVYDTITPVNAFRLIFRHYFGEDVPRLEDRTYWSWFPWFLRFMRVY